ncbi:MAG: hypothetical protein LBL74_03795 [Bacteroidales bacterium]|jgi:hypothetical protein|nr:hypothetical protein [Bacteroidales bacterium]
MKISGFSFIRNALKFDYPIVEAINSVLPLCDEFVLALGNSDDQTQSLIASIDSPKLRIIHTLRRFDGTHPQVMQTRIDNKNWKFDFDPTKKNFGFKAKILHCIERLTGWRIGEYKNYRIIK